MKAKINKVFWYDESRSWLAVNIQCGEGFIELRLTPEERESVVKSLDHPGNDGEADEGEAGKARTKVWWAWETIKDPPDHYKYGESVSNAVPVCIYRDDLFLVYLPHHIGHNLSAICKDPEGHMNNNTAKVKTLKWTREDTIDWLLDQYDFEDDTQEKVDDLRNEYIEDYIDSQLDDDIKDHVADIYQEAIDEERKRLNGLTNEELLAECNCSVSCCPDYVVELVEEEQ